MTSTRATVPIDFPAVDGRTVTEGHARICAERGHATHTIDGRDAGTCPRCGEVTEPTNTMQHSWDVEDGWCHTHRAYCSMAADA